MTGYVRGLFQTIVCDKNVPRQVDIQRRYIGVAPFRLRISPRCFRTENKGYPQLIRQFQLSVTPP